MAEVVLGAFTQRVAYAHWAILGEKDLFSPHSLFSIPTMKLFLPLILVSVVLILIGLPAHGQTPSRDMIGVVDLTTRYGGLDGWLTSEQTGREGLPTYQTSETLPYSDEVPTSERRLSIRDFETAETDYEYPEVVVYRRLNDWVMVRLDDAPVWIKMDVGDTFTSYGELFDDDRLAYLLSGDIWLAEYPGGPLKPHKLTAKLAEDKVTSAGHFEPSIVVIGRAVVDDFETYNATQRERYGRNHTRKVWFQIRLPEITCGLEAISEPEFTTAWIPARNAQDEISAWFSARGC